MISNHYSKAPLFNSLSKYPYRNYYNLFKILVTVIILNRFSFVEIESHALNLDVYKLISVSSLMQVAGSVAQFR